MKGRQGSIIRRWSRRVFRAVVLLILIGVLVIAYANLVPVLVSRGLLYDEPGGVPHNRVGLVFGCGHRIDGRENLYFRYRMDAAAALWKAGKLDCIIVSGDNRTKYYNEPERMRQALISLGVPDDRIVPDFAGLRTLDSVVRAKEVFGATEITFISQKFQNERAIYLARANGMSATGFNAADVTGGGGFKTRFREVGARVKMWLDVHVLRTRPKYSGTPEDLPL